MCGSSDELDEYGFKNRKQVKKESRKRHQSHNGGCREHQVNQECHGEGKYARVGKGYIYERVGLYFALHRECHQNR